MTYYDDEICEVKEMGLIFFKSCHSCKGLFGKREMKHDIMIGVHEPFSLCTQCYKKYFNKI